MRARSDNGAFESDKRVRVAGPVVEFSEHGARVLADRYWLEVSRVSRANRPNPRGSPAPAPGDVHWLNKAGKRPLGRLPLSRLTSRRSAVRSRHRPSRNPPETAGFSLKGVAARAG